MELFNSFKAINSKDVDGIVDFFIKNDYVVDNFTNIVKNFIQGQIFNKKNLCL